MMNPENTETQDYGIIGLTEFKGKYPVDIRKPTKQNKYSIREPSYFILSFRHQDYFIQFYLGVFKQWFQCLFLCDTKGRVIPLYWCSFKRCYKFFSYHDFHKKKAKRNRIKSKNNLNAVEYTTWGRKQYDELHDLEQDFENMGIIFPDTALEAIRHELERRYMLYGYYDSTAGRYYTGDY